MRTSIPDFFNFFDHVLNAGLAPGLTALNELSASDYDLVPVLMWSFINQGQQDNGLWGGILTLNLICEPNEMSTLTSAVYGQIRGWAAPGNGVQTTRSMGVESVTDGTIFALVSEGAMNGKHLLHLTSSFTLTIRDWSA